MKIHVLFVVLLSLFLFLFEIESSKYGRGVVLYPKRLVLGTELVYLNSPYLRSVITYDGGLFLISRNKVFKSDFLHVNVQEINKYAVKDNSLYLEIESDTSKMWLFDSINSINQKNPKIFEELPSCIELEWYNLANIPIFYFLWPTIAFFGIFVWLLLAFALVIKSYKSLNQ